MTDLADLQTKAIEFALNFDPSKKISTAPYTETLNTIVTEFGLTGLECDIKKKLTDYCEKLGAPKGSIDGMLKSLERKNSLKVTADNLLTFVENNHFFDVRTHKAEFTAERDKAHAEVKALMEQAEAKMAKDLNQRISTYANLIGVLGIDPASAAAAPDYLKDAMRQPPSPTSSSVSTSAPGSLNGDSPAGDSINDKHPPRCSIM